jgi:hypothetical protein
VVGDYAKGFHFKNSNLAGNDATTITIEGVHFEQGSSTTKYILFEDTSGVPFRCVTICRNSFIHASPIAIRLQRCQRVSIDGNRFGQTVVGAGVPIDIDANCEDVYVGAANWLAPLSTNAVPTYACDRSEVTFAPEVRPLNSVVLAGYDGNSFSTTASATIDMSTALGGFFPLVAPPKGYWVNVQARDQGSAGATGLVGVRLSKGGVTGNVQRQMLLCLSGLPGDVLSGASGFVPADANGDINVTMFATGLDTLDVWISVTGIAM